MRIIIIGAVAAGTSAAAKARRNNEEAQIVVYEKDRHISYSACGMPYFLGGEVDDAEELYPRDPAFFKTKYNVDIHTSCEVVRIDPATKKVEVKDLKSGQVMTDRYDILIIATGARSFIPPIKGAIQSHVFTLRSISDMLRIDEFLKHNSVRSAAIIGSGFIGIEMGETFRRRGLQVNLIELLPQITPAFDPDMAIYIKDHLEENGIRVLTGTAALEITPTDVLLSDGTAVSADLVLISAGVRPNIELAREAGIQIGSAGAIKVDHKMKTNLEGVYACGDCTEQIHLVSGRPVYRPLGTTANKMGRTAGDCATGGDLEFRGVLGTGIFRLFEKTAAVTGLTEKEAAALGYDAEIIHNIKPDKPQYMGGREMVIKGVADRSSGRLLGAQIVGYEGVDKRIDVFATAISFKAAAEDLFHLDLAYAPPYSITKDPVIYTGMILQNALSRDRKIITPDQLDERLRSGQKSLIIDTRVPEQYGEGHIEQAQNIPQDQVRDALEGLDKDQTIITYCNSGTTGNAVQNILLNKGFTKVYNLSGGNKQFSRCLKIRKK